MWSGLGNGVRTPPMGVDVDYRRLGPIWDAIKKLPSDARVACQVGDQECDNVPLFGMRPNNGGYETMQPWLVKSWQRQLARAEDTTSAIYATKPEEILSFASKYKVSHFLIQRSRLAEDFRSRSRSFEPLSSFTRKLLEGKQASITQEADKTLSLLHEEGSSVAFPESVSQMREDMEQITARLARAKPGRTNVIRRE
jgi:hypothetical protein